MILKCEVCNIAYATQQYSQCPLCIEKEKFSRYAVNTKRAKRSLINQVALLNQKMELFHALMELKERVQNVAKNNIPKEAIKKSVMSALSKYENRIKKGEENE